MIRPDVADQVVALVRDRLPLLDPADLDELRDAIVKLGDPASVLKGCLTCQWAGVTTSTHCGQCGSPLTTGRQP